MRPYILTLVMFLAIITHTGSGEITSKTNIKSDTYISESSSVPTSSLNQDYNLLEESKNLNKKTQQLLDQLSK